MSTRRDFLLQTVAAGSVATGVADNVAATSGHNGGSEARKASLRQYKIPQTDIVVSRLAYGCSSLAEWNRDPLSADAIDQAVRVINSAYDKGITFFDMADMYAFGKSELVFGRALSRSPGLRNHIVVQSKCGLVFEHVQPGGPYFVDCSSDYIVRSVEASLRRLGTDHLDILLLHWPDALVRPEAVATAFDNLKRGGKVRHFGVSNHTASQIAVLQKWVPVPIVVNQIHLSLADSYLMAGGLAALWRSDRTPFEDTACSATLDYCRLHNVQIQAYSPLRSDLLNPGENATPELRQAVQKISELAAKKNSTPTAISLAWLLHHPAQIVPIIGSTKPAHIADNCASDEVVLTSDEWYSLLVATVNLASARKA